MNRLLTAERLREVLAYDPSTGIFTWYPQIRKGGWKEERKAGTRKSTGHLVIRVDDVLYHAHRLAWLWVYGEWPKGDIDHINGDRQDNRISNLRDVTRRENSQNLERHRQLGSHVLGASYYGGGWYARKRINGELVYLGKYKTQEEAHAAYMAKEVPV